MQKTKDLNQGTIKLSALSNSKTDGRHCCFLRSYIQTNKMQNSRSKLKSWESLGLFKDRSADMVALMVLYSIKKGCPIVHWIIGKMYAKKKKKQGPDSWDEKVISLWSHFRDRKTDILACRGYLCDKKGYPTVHWILGRLHAKKSRT